MNLTKRLKLALLLSLPIWLILDWIYVLSPSSAHFPLGWAIVLSLGIAIVSGYILVMFLIELKRS